MDDRYDFGRNWRELAASFDSTHLEEAKRGLTRLVGNIEGGSFLDIGCGSGLHSAAALALGARKVSAIDYDPACVSTANAVLERFAPGGAWSVARADALDANTLPREQFDVVYSWGVLHHTGNMWLAISNAAARVSTGGELCLALYLKTPLCGLWTIEKRLYARQRWLRPAIKWPFVAARLLARQVRSGDAVAYVRHYHRQRGMEFLTDADDWLGGYPYESVSPLELVQRVEALGFDCVASFNTTPGKGILGTGCGEWRFRRATGRQGSP